MTPIVEHSVLDVYISHLYTPSEVSSLGSKQLFT